MDRRAAAVTRWSMLAVRLVVGGVFVYSGWLKARDPGAFIRDLWNYRLVPEDAAYWIAAYLPFLEIVAGLALVTGLQRRGAHVVLTLLLGVFVAALASAWSRGLDISCGCFGSSPSEKANYPWLIGRDLVLLVGVALSVVLKPQARTAPTRPSRRPLRPPRRADTRI